MSEVGQMQEKWDFRQDYKNSQKLIIKDFEAVSEAWSVFIFDVRASTQAIAEGRYRQVNMVGAMGLAAAFNHFGRRDFPFVFGGDGATFLLPTSEIPGFRSAIEALQLRSKREFFLELRAGYVSVAELRKRGFEVLLRQSRRGKSFSKSDFLGGALDLAEVLIKAGESPAVLIQRDPLDDSGDEALSLEGLECRWEPIWSKHGYFYSVIIRPLSTTVLQSHELIERILKELPLHRNLDSSQLQLVLRPWKLLGELRAHATRMQGKLQRFFNLIRMWIYTAYGYRAMARGLQKGDVNWGRYRDDVISNTDQIKIDDSLRFVLDLSDADAKRVFQFLDRHEASGELLYAFHQSQSAQLTCFVESIADDHIHFIDGSDGGYASAAKILKSKIQKLRNKNS